MNVYYWEVDLSKPATFMSELGEVLVNWCNQYLNKIYGCFLWSIKVTKSRLLYMAYKAGNIIKPPKGLKIKTHLCTGLCIITNVLKNHTLQNTYSITCRFCHH